MSARVLAAERASDARLDFDVIDDKARSLGLSKGELAALIGVNYSTMWRYRKGMIPSHAVVRRFQLVLDLTEDQLMPTGSGA